MKVIDSFCLLRPILSSLVAFCLLVVILFTFGLKVTDLRLVDLLKVQLIGFFLSLLHHFLCLLKIRSIHSFVILMVPSMVTWYYVFTFASELKTMDEVYIPLSLFAIMHLALICFLKSKWFCKVA